MASNGFVEFVLIERQLRVFRYGLQSLQKIGSELIVEAMPSRLDLRAINSSQSAILSLTYNVNFFETYDVINCNALHTGILIKNILSVLRSQRVNKVSFKLMAGGSKAIVVVHCENGLVKTYNFPLVETEIVHAMADKSALPVTLVAETQAMTKLLSSFHGSATEITVMAQGDELHDPDSKVVQLQSFIDPQRGSVEHSLHTRLAVDTHVAFINYINNAEGSTDVTFNLKDFKAILSLCENLGSDIALYFQGPGGPLVVEPRFRHANVQDADYTAELILATLTESFWSPPPRAAEQHNHGNYVAAATAVQAGRGHEQDQVFLGPDAYHREYDQHGGRVLFNDDNESDGMGDVPNTPPDEEPNGLTLPGVIA